MMKQPNSRSDYLSRQLISYIGNKRRLLSLIEGVLKELYSSDGKGRCFVDPFAGSGVVSRLANTLGFQVISNDWEYYAALINRCYLLYSPEEAEELFHDEGGLNGIIEILNNLPDPDPEDYYFAKFYAPRDPDPEKAVLGRERLFYTRQNALRLDAIRAWIDTRFGENSASGQRDLLLGPLLYLASKHTNTSGVFKAYHKGFGGYGKDALKRILHPIRMEAPVLWNGQRGNRVYQKDANQLVKEIDPCDVLYLDPPYNQHQYGSNYHILNTLALWDRIPQPLEYSEKGELLRKAAIRTDWIETRSPYCRKDAAAEALSDLLESARAEYILISYSTDGLIPLEQMRKICESRGRVRLVSNEYPVYRGGRQSSRRRVRNIEFLWVIDPAKKNTRTSRNDLSSQLLRKEIRLICKGVYPVDRLSEFSDSKEGVLELVLDGRILHLNTPNPWTIAFIDLPADMNLRELKKLKSLLEKNRFHRVEDEVDFLIKKIREGSGSSTLYGLILKGLRKLAHPTSKEAFKRLYEESLMLEEQFPELSRQKSLRIRLKETAEKRLGPGLLDLMESIH